MITDATTAPASGEKRCTCRCVHSGCKAHFCRRGSTRVICVTGRRGSNRQVLVIACSRSLTATVRTEPDGVACRHAGTHDVAHEAMVEVQPLRSAPALHVQPRVPVATAAGVLALGHALLGLLLLDLVGPQLVAAGRRSHLASPTGNRVCEEVPSEVQHAGGGRRTGACCHARCRLKATRRRARRAASDRGVEAADVRRHRNGHVRCRRHPAVHGLGSVPGYSRCPGD